MAKKENNTLDHHHDLTDVIIGERDGVQYRFSVSEFRESYYLSVREWYLDFDEEWKPSKNGFTMPYNLASVSKLFAALAQLLADAEVLNEVRKYVDELEDIPRVSDDSLQ